MTIVVLDTNHWISLERDPELHDGFLNKKREHGFTVVFTRGNFVDLAKRSEQDTMSRVITETTDAFVAVDTYNADEYYRSDDPLVLAPPDTQDFHAGHTEDFDVERTLRFMFRILEQDPDPHYEEQTRALKEIYDVGGESWLLHTLFYKYSDWEGKTVRTNVSDAHKLEFVRKQQIVEHVKQLKDEERVTTTDYVDMEICAYAVFDADVFISEAKWVNAEIIPRVLEGVEGAKIPVIVPGFDEFFDVIPGLCSSEK